ncbi:MAG: hypothetical protein FWE36_07510 [Erysipelotrichales bacterium]|nr:hypothetical protein [Erysipelotrichales bacterium]
MKIEDRQSIVTLNGKEMSVEEAARKFSKISSANIVEIFSQSKKLLPRQARMVVLRSLLDEQVRILKFKNLNLSDETNYRLNWYRSFSETQLLNLFAMLDEDGSLADMYKEDLWLMFLHMSNSLGVSDEALDELFANIDSAKISNRDDFIAYNETIGALFYDEPGQFDGIPFETFRESLSNSSTLVELRQIANIHNINVPRRIKKEELINIIFQALEDQGKLTDDVKETLPEKSVIQLQRFAKDNDIKASVELKKDEIIDYILKNLEFDQEKIDAVIAFDQIYPRRFNTVLPENWEFTPIKAEKVERVVVEKEVQTAQPIDHDALVILVEKIVSEKFTELTEKELDEKVNVIVNNIISEKSYYFSNNEDNVVEDVTETTEETLQESEVTEDVMDEVVEEAVETEITEDIVETEDSEVTEDKVQTMIEDRLKEVYANPIDIGRDVSEDCLEETCHPECNDEYVCLGKEHCIAHKIIDEKLAAFEEKIMEKLATQTEVIERDNEIYKLLAQLGININEISRYERESTTTTTNNYYYENGSKPEEDETVELLATVDPVTIDGTVVDLNRKDTSPKLAYHNQRTIKVGSSEVRLVKDILNTDLNDQIVPSTTLEETPKKKRKFSLLRFIVNLLFIIALIIAIILFLAMTFDTIGEFFEDIPVVGDIISNVDEFFRNLFNI